MIIILSYITNLLRLGSKRPSDLQPSLFSSLKKTMPVIDEPYGMKPKLP